MARAEEPAASDPRFVREDLVLDGTGEEYLRDVMILLGDAEGPNERHDGTHHKRYAR